MELGISGRTALITGGASGIGRAIVTDLAKEGVRVAFTSRNQKRGENLLREILEISSGHQFFNIDVSAKNGPKFLFDELSKSVLPSILINNVGDTLGITDPMCGLDDWKRVYRLNLEVHVEMIELFVANMIAAGWGRIVNITAGAALENSGPVPYCSIKAAYTAYSRSMARVLAPTGVVMSAVLPGVVLTEGGHWDEVLKSRPDHAADYLQSRTSLKRFGEPTEISPFVLLLCSELASFAVGSIIPVEGGQARHYFAGNRETYL
jgi:3-oxoacyl-[acyl-carrier protein] reductase